MVSADGATIAEEDAQERAPPCARGWCPGLHGGAPQVQAAGGGSCVRAPHSGPPPTGGHPVSLWSLTHAWCTVSFASQERRVFGSQCGEDGGWGAHCSSTASTRCILNTHVLVLGDCACECWWQCGPRGWARCIQGPPQPHFHRQGAWCLQKCLRLRAPLSTWSPSCIGVVMHTSVVGVSVWPLANLR
jgi:hypothetical protein